MTLLTKLLWVDQSVAPCPSFTAFKTKTSLAMTVLMSLQDLFVA